MRPTQLSLPDLRTRPTPPTRNEQGSAVAGKGVSVELSFVIAALRRRLWFVVLVMLVGLVGGAAFTSSKKAQFEASAELLIQPRSSAAGVTNTSDPDRFVAGEVASLKGSSIADRVVEKVPGTSRSMLAATVRVEQKAKTDVVGIIVRADDPLVAQQVANAYVTIYIASSEARNSEGYNAEIDEIGAKLKDLSDKINVIETERAKLPLNSTSVLDRTRDAQLFEQTSSLRAQYTQLIATQTTLQYSSKLKSRSEVLQLATLPTAPIVTSRVLLAGAGLFFGTTLGVVAAVAWANASRRLLDVVQLEEILGAKAVGTLPLAKDLASGPRAAFENLPDKTAAIIDQLCVRSEASAQGETDALTIAIVGSRRGAGVTTVALAMAGRFARNGARAVVIDGDLADPAISRSFQALDDAGIPGLLARLAAARKEPLAPGAPPPVLPDSLPARVFTPTSLPDVRVLGVGAPTKARSLHRTNVDVVIEAAARGGVDVVLIDGGPLLDSASTVRLCQVVDVVVLVVPVNHQQIEPLGVINRLLGYRSGDLLPVATRLKPRVSARPKPGANSEATEVDDIIEAATRWGAREAATRWGARDARDARTPAIRVAAERLEQPEAHPVPVSSVAPHAPAPINRGHSGRSAGPVPASPRLGAPPSRRTQLDVDFDLFEDDAPVATNGSRPSPFRREDADWAAREVDERD